VNITVAKNMEKENIAGMMDQLMKETGLKIKSKGLEHTNGWMEEAFKELG
jgi:GTP cyclohydrolase I